MRVVLIDNLRNKCVVGVEYVKQVRSVEWTSPCWSRLWTSSENSSLLNNVFVLFHGIFKWCHQFTWFSVATGFMFHILRYFDSFFDRVVTPPARDTSPVFFIVMLYAVIAYASFNVQKYAHGSPTPSISSTLHAKNYILMTFYKFTN